MFPPTRPPATPPVQTPACFARVVQHSSRGAAWIRLSGELDLATAGRLTRILDDALARARQVVIDLRQLTFMDSTGLGAVVRAHDRARTCEQRLVLIRGPQQVDRLLQVTGLSDRLEITDLMPIQAQAAPAWTAPDAA